MTETVEVEGVAEHLLLDMFRRADKNDDGKISPEEFRMFFRDSNLAKDEYEKLFQTIDANNDGSLTLNEIFTFFKKGFKPFETLFKATDDLHQQIGAVLGQSHADSQQESSDSFERAFRTKVFLKELLVHLDAAQSVVETALDHMERENRSAASHDAAAAAQNVIEVSQLSAKEMPPTHGQASGSSALAAQVDRLALLLNKLETKLDSTTA